MRLTDPRLRRIQVLSGLGFGLFLSVHLANQAAAAVGARAYDGVQDRLRVAYQAPVLELVLVMVPMLAHAASGVLVMLRRRGSAAPRIPGYLRVHRYAGRVLLVFFVGHVVATRGASLFFDVLPGFAGIAFTFQWVPAYFWPYYALFALSALVHLVIGAALALPTLGISGGGQLLRSRGRLGIVLVLGGVALMAGVLGLGGALYDVGTPRDSDYAKLLVRLGVAKP